MIRTGTSISREPRGIPDYERAVALLANDQLQRLELAEESVLSDRDRAHARRTLADGTVFDATAYDEFGVALTYREVGDGREFISFAIHQDAVD